MDVCVSELHGRHESHWTCDSHCWQKGKTWRVDFIDNYAEHNLHRIESGFSYIFQFWKAKLKIFNSIRPFHKKNKQFFIHILT